MDTKEKRRRPSRGGKKAPERGRASAQRRPRRKPVNQTTAKPKRVVRAPREDIPEVVYTMPQPFRKGKFLLKLLSVVAVVIALMGGLSLFFRVDTIIVSGAEKYTPWMIREASGIEEGESLLGISEARIAGKIQAQLPYVAKVKVGINLPGTVHIEIRELQVTYAIQASDATWWLIASDGTVVEQIESSAASAYTRILGVQADAPRVGQTVQAFETAPQTEATEPPEDPTGLTIPVRPQITGAQRLGVALEIAQALEKNGVIGRIASMDVNDLQALTMEYAQRFHVVLGNSERLDYKIAYMAQAISQVEDYQIGELDVSFEYSDQALLTQDG